MGLLEWHPLVERPLLGGPRLGPPATAVKLQGQSLQGPQVQVEGEYLSDGLGFHLVDDQLPAIGMDVVPQDREPAGPLSLASGRGHLVPGSVRANLPLMLGEAQENI